MLTIPRDSTALTCSNAALTHETWQRPEEVCFMGFVVKAFGIDLVTQTYYSPPSSPFRSTQLHVTAMYYTF